MTTGPIIPTGDVTAAERYVADVFVALIRRYGPKEALRIFARYAPAPAPQTKREINRNQDEALKSHIFVEYVQAVKEKRSPNMRQLARRLAKKNGSDFLALKQKIWRIERHKHIAEMRRMIKAELGL
jgi:hypothetical protein